MMRLTVCMITLVVLLAAVSAATRVKILRKCGEQIERHRLGSCIEYLRDSSRFENDKGRRGWREEFPLCCEELEQINEQCRCQAVKLVVQQQCEEGVVQGRELREMLKTAQSLTSLCRISPQSCEISPRAPATFLLESE